MKSIKILVVWKLMKTNKCYDFLFLALLLLIIVPHKLVAGPLHHKSCLSCLILFLKPPILCCPNFHRKGGGRVNQNPGAKLVLKTWSWKKEVRPMKKMLQNVWTWKRLIEKLMNKVPEKFPVFFASAPDQTKNFAAGRSVATKDRFFSVKLSVGPNF